MSEGEIPPLKKEGNNPIKEEILEEEGKKLSRDIARKYIYVRNKEKYPLPFEEYKLYHIDGKLFNDSPDNLYLCTKEQRKALYAEQMKRQKPFESSKEIDEFLQKIGKNYPEISKDRRIYEKRYNTKIPLYWKQRETRKRQLAPIKDPHPELREKLIDEIRNVEDEIEEIKEESRFYSLPPKRHPELRKRLIEEIKEAEDLKKRGRRMTLTEKIILLVVILAVTGIFLFIFKNYLFIKPQEIQGKPFDLSKSKLQTNISSEQFFRYEIRTDRYFILVINNENEGLNLEIEYNRYSHALEINENKTIKAYVPAKDNVLLKDPEFSRDLGCIKNDCEVSIISSRRV
jgi:hypothetical protein